MKFFTFMASPPFDFEHCWGGGDEAFDLNSDSFLGEILCGMTRLYVLD